MKKFLALLLVLITSFAFVACSSASSNESKVNSEGSNSESKVESSSEQESKVKDNLTFYAPDGAPALSIAKFIKDGEDFGMDANVTYNVVAADKIAGVVTQGKGDFVIMPVNAASKVYKANSSDPYVMAGVVTHGNLYIVSDEEITLQGLKGKVIGVIGQGLVPDLTFKAILSDNGLLDDVVAGDTPTEGKISIRYFQQASDMLPLLKQGLLTVGLLPEPAATNLTTKVAPQKTWFRLDVQELYDNNAKAYPQAVLMVKKSVYNKYKTQIDGFAQYFEANLTWIKTNPADAVTAINGALPDGVTPSLNAGILSATVIDNCKIYYQTSADAKQEVKDYINKIIAVNENSAKAVLDEFFA